MAALPRARCLDCYTRGTVTVTHGSRRQRAYLSKRGRRWYFRRRFPLDLAELVGRTEITRSLGTSRYSVARARAARAEVGLDVLFRLLRIIRASRAACTLFGVATSDDLIHRLCELYFCRFLESAREHRRTRYKGGRPHPRPPEIEPDVFLDWQDELSITEDVLQEEGSKLLEGDRSTVLGFAEELLAEASEPLRGDNLERFLYELHRIHIEAARHCIEEDKADVEGRPRPPLPVEHAAPPQPAPKPQPDLGPPLGEVVDDYLRTEGERWGAPTRREKAHRLEWLKALLGPSRLIRSITPDDCDRYVQFLRRVPPGTPATADVMAMLEGPTPSEVLAPGTIHKAARQVNEMFIWLRKRKILESNPMEGLVPRKTSPQRPRVPYASGELAKLFSEGYVAETLGKGRPARFWLPLLALYSGARRGELAQLHVDDITEQEGIPCIVITEEGGEKRVKTASSRRTFPVHPHLAELGFLEFVDERRRTDPEALRLFSDVVESSHGFGDAEGKWFSRRRRRLGLTRRGARLDFHSFRNTALVELRDAGVDMDFRKAQVGHVNTDITAHYEGPPTITQLRKAIENLDFREELKALEAELAKYRSEHPRWQTQG